MPFFGPVGQMAHLLPLFVGVQLVVLVVRLALGAPLPPAAWLAQSLSTTLLWPLADLLLLAPQRRAVDRDDNRPI